MKTMSNKSIKHKPDFIETRQMVMKIPSFASRIDRDLTQIEKDAIRDKFSGMDEATQKEVLRYISTDLIRTEFNARDKAVKDALSKIKLRISTGLKYNMTPEAMKALLDDINEIAKEGGEGYGNK